MLILPSSYSPTSYLTYTGSAVQLRLGVRLSLTTGMVENGAGCGISLQPGLATTALHVALQATVVTFRELNSIIFFSA